MPQLIRLAWWGVRSALPAVVVLGLLGAGQAGARPTPAPSTGRTYVVAAGETLSQVARRTGVSIDSLAAANKITDVHRIRAGHRLVVPGSAPTAEAAPDDQSSARFPTRLREQPHRLALLPRFDAAAREFGVPADLLKAITWQESGWQNDKVSVTNARGIGQLMPDTVAFVNGSLLRARPRLDPNLPEHNIRMSARFLAYLLQRTKGDTRAAVSAYYQGLRSVQTRGPYPGTLRYADAVLALRKKF